MAPGMEFSSAVERVTQTFTCFFMKFAEIRFSVPNLQRSYENSSPYLVLGLLYEQVFYYFIL